MTWSPPALPTRAGLKQLTENIVGRATGRARTDARPPHEMVPGNPLRALASPVLWRASIHLALDGLVALAGLAVLVVLVVALCLAPVGLVGLPLTVAAGWALFRLAAVERARFAVTCGLELDELPAPVCSWRLAKSLQSLVHNLCTWRLIGYFVLLTPVAVVTVVAVALIWAVPLTLVLLPAYYRGLPGGQAQLGPFVVDSLPRALLVAAVALLGGAVLSPLIVKILLALDTALAVALLSRPRGLELEQRVNDLTESRARVVDAAEAERKRIERDLHDGAQQRLVAMSITLGRASSRLKKSGDHETNKLVEDARRETLSTIAELRNLARGLHPPVLTDRGLEAALSAVAALVPVPVRLDVLVEPRPSSTIEAVAYFTVTEALTNVAKHAHATRAWVEIRREGARLDIKVGDDGRGGADLAAGTGLTGLADRVSGVDGRFRLSSPVGGPTVIEVDLPCG
ncbi:MAG: sensor domain-containing protein [Streptomyces sp.]|uniref:sensor histidine kinase n=1 Tax=Streptomyces sp. TaxID=1931 RepID=UPI0025F74BBD|nr:sensor domain-containing protein [Streptomyces sp.]MBW8799049.1 sensor domain-containing protein [Streptomyces sp.]